MKSQLLKYLVGLPCSALVLVLASISTAIHAEEQQLQEAIVIPLEKTVDVQPPLKADPTNIYECQVEAASEELVDIVRASAHTRLCNTAGWLDGLFGDDEKFKGNEFRGKISVGFREDEVDGLDPRIRVRIKADLPNLSSRLNAFIGRVEEDSYVSNTEIDADRLNSVGLPSTDDEEDEWLIGLGYRNPNKDANGWDYSIGAKLSGGLKPYAKMTHRHLFDVGDDRYWKTNQTLFWREQEGFGVSSNLEFTQIVDESNILIMHGSVKYTEEEKQLEWFTDAKWHHSFTEKRGMSSGLYVRGEAENEIAIPEFGVTLTYLRPILREWLYMEIGLDSRWERDSKAQTNYKHATRFGIQFEMLLGDYYQRKHRKPD